MATEPLKQKPAEILHWIGEPKRVCGNCEHFDGGGLDKRGRPINEYGDCHNGISGTLTTKASAPACARGFYPCSTRWPLHKWLGIKP